MRRSLLAEHASPNGGSAPTTTCLSRIFEIPMPQDNQGGLFLFVFHAGEGLLDSLLQETAADHNAILIMPHPDAGIHIRDFLVFRDRFVPFPEEIQHLSLPYQGYGVAAGFFLHFLERLKRVVISFLIIKGKTKTEQASGI